MFGLRKYAFGLEISEESIKAVELEKRGKCLAVASYGESKLPKRTIERGEIINPQSLIEQIEKLLKEAKPRPIKSRKVVVSTPEARSFIRTIKIPSMESKEAEEAIRWETEANIPISADKVYLDWQKIKNDGKQSEILVVAVPKAIIESYYDAVTGAGLKPVAIEVDIIATIRALTLEKGNLAPFLIADIGSSITTIAICKNQVPYFTSSIPVSGKSFTDSLRKTLGMIEESAEKKKLELSKEKLMDEKFINKSYESIIENLAAEIEKCIGFYHESIDDKDQIEAIILTGGSSKIKNLPEMLIKRLGRRVVIGALAVNVYAKCPKIQIPDDEIPRFTTPIGLALRGQDYESYTKSSAG